MLRIRRLPIDTHPDNTAFMLRQSNGYSAEQFQALRKIRVTGEASEILATLALVDDKKIIANLRSDQDDRRREDHRQWRNRSGRAGIPATGPSRGR